MLLMREAARIVRDEYFMNLNRYPLAQEQTSKLFLYGVVSFLSRGGNDIPLLKSKLVNLRAPVGVPLDPLSP